MMPDKWQRYYDMAVLMLACVILVCATLGGCLTCWMTIFGKL